MSGGMHVGLLAAVLATGAAASVCQAAPRQVTRLDGADWTLNATGLAAKRDYAIVKKADGNLYLRVMARGMCIIFR